MRYYVRAIHSVISLLVAVVEGTEEGGFLRKRENLGPSVGLVACDSIQ